MGWVLFRPTKWNETNFVEVYTSVSYSRSYLNFNTLEYTHQKTTYLYIYVNINICIWFFFVYNICQHFLSIFLLCGPPSPIHEISFQKGIQKMNSFPCTLLGLLASCTRMNQFYIKLNYYLGGNRSPFSSSYSHVPKTHWICVMFVHMDPREKTRVPYNLIHPPTCSFTDTSSRGSARIHIHTYPHCRRGTFRVFFCISNFCLFRLELRHGVA